MPVADLILKNANIITVDPHQPAAELVAIKGDKILFVGKNKDLNSFKEATTRTIDCQGKTLVPGFIDAHCHIFSFIRKQLSIDLSPPAIRSINDIKATIRQKVQNTPPGQWITGSDYNDFYLDEKRHPNRWDIDEVAPDHPVILSHRSLHACVLNSKALVIAGITSYTPEPPGGLIDRDINTGEPTGLLYEMVGYIRYNVMPQLSDAELEEGVAITSQHYLSQGLTSLQDATVTNEVKRWQIYQHLQKSGKFNSRIYMMTGADKLKEFKEAGLTFGAGDESLRMGGLKIVLGEATGRLYPPQPELNQMVLNAHRDGYQVAIHAVQPSTIEAAIIAIEYARKQLPQVECRHRIEHCAECPQPLLERLKKLKTVIATQPPFFYYSGERYLAMIPPDHIPWLYRIKSFLENGLVVVGSSDSPIVSDNPLVGIYSAVTRQAATGQVLVPEERISIRQALEMYTINAAYASFEEDIKGSLTRGKLADMVLLSGDLYHVPPEEIKDIKVEMTVIGGKVVWEA
jgi:predicted amidohydrolase YtcJ